MQNSDPILTNSRNDYSYCNHLFREFVIISIEGFVIFMYIGKRRSVCAHGVVACTLRCGVGDPSSSLIGT